jgi:cytochrome P450
MSKVKQGQPPKALARCAADVVVDFTKSAQDPTSHFADLRARCPVALQAGGGTNGGARAAWLLTRYDDIVAAARDTETFGQSIRFEERRRPPLESNPPEHRQWRTLLQPFFLPKIISSLEPTTRSIADALLSPLIEAGGGDFAHQVARPLPPQVLLSWMRQPLVDWLPIKDACEAAYLQSSDDHADLARFQAADDYLWRYAQDAVAARCNQQHDVAIDPVAAMVAAIRHDGPITEELIVGVVRLILAAGHDSTTSALGICLEYIASDADLQATLREQPRQIPAAIEEILRLRTPVLQMPRTIMRDVELRGRPLAADDAALLVFGSGNLDEEAFPDASTFRLNRSPNRHLAFGTGVHTCIGNILARQEIRVVVEELLKRTASVEIDGAPDREFWHPHGTTHLALLCKT